jgi:hypothetical protein
MTLPISSKRAITITTSVVSALVNYYGIIVYQISPPLVFDSSGAPGVFYTYFYNHARCLRLEAPADILNRFWIQVAVSLLKRPLLNRLKRLKFITVILFNGHSPTGTSVRSGVTVM